MPATFWGSLRCSVGTSVECPHLESLLHIFTRTHSWILCLWLCHLGGDNTEDLRATDAPKCCEIWWNCRFHLFDIAARFGTGLDEHDVQLLGSLLAFLDRDLPAVKDVGPDSASWRWRLIIQHWHVAVQQDDFCSANEIYSIHTIYVQGYVSGS